MTLIDALIIYLALGAPVAMYRFFQLPRPFSVSAAAGIIVVFVFWPVWAIRLVMPARLSLGVTTQFVTRETLDVHITENIEKLKNSVFDVLSAEVPATNASTIKEDLDAYVEYSTVLALEYQRSRAEIELLNVSGHPDVSLGAACLRRKNRRHLEKQRSLTSKRIAQSMRDPIISDSKGRRVNERIRAIAMEFDDVELATAIGGISPMPVSQTTENVVYA